mmetsp:Transcript_15950/g.45856  ORF Transcript_15950/g.45856 Transcript_15950/m.45856 type:complete len:80 (-) Transcript_15950:20-259(-)
MEPFEVTLDRLVILPHLEGMEERGDAAMDSSTSGGSSRRTGAAAGRTNMGGNGARAIGPGTEILDSMRAEEEADREETL